MRKKVSILDEITGKQKIKLVMDFSFISRHIPQITPVRFRDYHTKQFLEMLHPNLSLEPSIFQHLRAVIPKAKAEGKYYKEKLKEYYAEFGIPMEHLLISTQTECSACGSKSKPVSVEGVTVEVYVSLSKEPEHGFIIPSRCVSPKCRHLW